jgi:hypothetical protein
MRCGLLGWWPMAQTMAGAIRIATKLEPGMPNAEKSSSSAVSSRLVERALT